MKFDVCAIAPKTWREEFAILATHSSFGMARNPDLDRIDFALISFADEVATGFVTCIEMDAETLYWQIGGAFITAQNTRNVVPCYIAFIDWSFERYRRIWTRIENDNIRMLNLAMKMGFRVIGTWNFKNKIYLELINEVKNGND